MDREPPPAFGEMRLHPVVWIPSRIASELLSEADRWFDLETGGSLMGYWANDREAVVTSHIPAGPEAKRERYRFEPDLAWQQAEIDRHYAAAGRMDTYLGDWHTHPRATSAHLSFTDRSTARKIIQSAAARQPRPIMMLLTGERNGWAMVPLICEMKSGWWMLPYLEHVGAECRFY